MPVTRRTAVRLTPNATQRARKRTVLYLSAVSVCTPRRPLQFTPTVVVATSMTDELLLAYL